MPSLSFRGNPNEILELFNLKILADYTDDADLKYRKKSARDIIKQKKRQIIKQVNLSIQFLSSFFSI